MLPLLIGCRSVATTCVTICVFETPRTVTAPSALSELIGYQLNEPRDRNDKSLHSLGQFPCYAKESNRCQPKIRPSEKMEIGPIKEVTRRRCRRTLSCKNAVRKCIKSNPACERTEEVVDKRLEAIQPSGFDLPGFHMWPFDSNASGCKKYATDERQRKEPSVVQDRQFK
jgi:hypothetical protein